MKLVTFDDNGAAKLGVLAGGRVLDVLEAAGEQDATAGWLVSMLALIEGEADAMTTLSRIVDQARAHHFRSLPEVRLLAPIPRPRKNIFCVGRNYVDHIKEGSAAQGKDFGLPEHIQLFSKPPTAVIGPHAAIRHDKRVSDRMDYEVELAVVIGKTGRDISEEKAMEHVFGYTIVDDITARDLQRRHDQWFKGKGLDASCPMGPCIVTADEIADPHQLELLLRVNGSLRQRATTQQMIFRIPHIIAALSRGLTLEAGDVIATGTPSGVGYAMNPPHFLQPGDVVLCEIEGIGELSNTVEAVAA